MEANTLDLRTRLHTDAPVPLCFWVGAPIWSARHLTATLDFADNVLSIIFSGNLYPYRNSMREAGIGGDYGEPDEAGRREYFRELSSLNVADVRVQEQVRSALTSVIFNTLVRCDVRTAPMPDSAAFAFLTDLKGTP